MDSSETIIISPEIEAKVKGILFTLPRELSGRIVSAIDKCVDDFQPGDITGIVDKWYKSAGSASYNSHAAATAYLGAYGPRSILKYQEAIFALIILRGNIRRKTKVIDYGSGPAIGFAALLDLFDIIGGCMQEEMELEYLAFDRSVSMLEVGKAFCNHLASKNFIKASYELHHANDFNNVSADMLIVSNVMNDGEGNNNCYEFMTGLANKVGNIDDIIVIEPATEQPSRQLCNLSKAFESHKHIGPCPSYGFPCEEWSYHQFSKRVYSFERLCLGQWAPAARDCKYSLALLSKVAETRQIADGEYVIVGQPSVSGWALGCHKGQKQNIKVTPQVNSWDIVDRNGRIKRWWP